MRLRTLVVDDEELARGSLIDLLRERGDVSVIGEAESIEGTVAALRRTEPDLMFLDITLIDGSAFDLFARTPVRCPVVFLTASEDHAIRAFEVEAVDYLLKPTESQDIERALSRVTRRMRGQGAANGEARTAHRDRVVLQKARRVSTCSLSEIVWIRASDDYTEVRLLDGATSLVSRRLREWLTILPRSFAQCHRSLLVNLTYVEELKTLEGGGARLRLRTVMEPLSVSRRFAPAFRRHLLQHTRH